MDKIGIVTIIDNENYGNRLQNYAVVNVFRKLGFSPECLILNQRKGHKKYLPRALRMVMMPIINKINRKNNHLRAKRIRRFKRFNYKHGIVIKTMPMWSVRHLRMSFKFFSVGSDQIWNPSMELGYETEFLGFAEPNQRITMSPSFGVNVIPEHKKAAYMKGLAGFKYVSVREESGADIVRELAGIEAEVIIDPTMMLTKDEWIVISNKPSRVNTSKPYILEYFLGGKSRETEREIQEYAKKNALQEIILLDESMPDIYCVDPGEFIYLIQNAEIIATDSFHAVVFSILFEKPFAIYERMGHKEMGTRISTLLNKFIGASNVSEITIDNAESVFTNNRFTYADVLSKERTKAYNFLEKSIHGNVY